MLRSGMGIRFNLSQMLENVRFDVIGDHTRRFVQVGCLMHRRILFLEAPSAYSG
jgi:hypothetical protein